MAIFRFDRIKDGLPQGVVKWEPNEVAMGYAMDLSVEDKALSDAAKRKLYADRILEKYDFTLDPNKDMDVVRAKLDDWLSDQSTATSDEILIDLISLLRDKGIV
jgi:hypothetical protein